ncbi:unnamed protein product [Hymenolepis diminuta]|nr:unnamed protein product [Hymenolepis diminuta]
MQALPAPTQPQVEYIQPGGPPPLPSLLEQMPNPPTDEMPARKTSRADASDSDVEADKGARRPPTPQLICLE